MEFLKAVTFGILVALTSVGCFAADEAEEKPVVTQESKAEKKLCNEDVSPKIYLLKGGRLI